MPIRGGMRIANNRGRRGRGHLPRGRGNGTVQSGMMLPNANYVGVSPSSIDMDFTEDIQMSGTNHPWENSTERKRNGPSIEQTGSPKKLRLQGPSSLLPTPPRPMMLRPPPPGGPFPRFRPPLPLDMVPPPGRFFGPGPRGSARPIGPPPRVPGRFPPPSFTRSGPPAGPAPFRPINPSRGFPLRGSPHLGRSVGFGGGPRMFRQ